MSALLELAERCEAATGPDRELNIAIHRAHHRFPETWPQSYESASVSNYTASLDAAMTLVPEGCVWTLEPDAAWVRWMGENDVEETQGYLSGKDGKCTALALCAAALRARAA